MSNVQLKNGLDTIVRELSTLPGVPAAASAQAGARVASISAKIDWTNGLDTGAVPPEMKHINPKNNGQSAGLLGALTGLPRVGADGSAGDNEWLRGIGIAGHEDALDTEQNDHSENLDQLVRQSSECADSVKKIDSAANTGIQILINILLSLIHSAKIAPLLKLGASVAAPILQGLLSIENTVDDRNKSIGGCYDGLRQLCEGAGEKTPPSPKQYAPAEKCAPPADEPKPAPEPVPECEPAPEPAPAPKPAAAPEPCPPEPAKPAVEQPSPVKPVPEQVIAPECPPTTPADAAPPEPGAPPASQPTVPTQVKEPLSSLPPLAVPPQTTVETPPAPTPTPPSPTTAAGSGGSMNITVTIDAAVDNECPPTIPQAAPSTPVVPVPQAVPPVGPAGECVVAQVVAGLEAFGQTVVECLEQIDCPQEPVDDCPPPEPAPEPKPAPVADCPEEEPEPEPEPEPVADCPEESPEPEPAPECEPDGTITPPPELAEVKEPPPPPKKGLVEPAGLGGGEAAEAAPEPAPETPAQQPPAEQQPVEPPEEQQRARKTGAW